LAACQDDGGTSTSRGRNDLPRDSLHHFPARASQAVLDIAGLVERSRPGRNGLAEIQGLHGRELVAVFYPTESEGPAVQRWQFSLPVVEQAPPARGNGRLVVISHGSPSNPWVNTDLAIALTRAGFIVAALWHFRDNFGDSSDAGPVSWKRRPHEVSAAIDAVLADARFGLLLQADRVGAYGMSAGGHTLLTLAGGRWSPPALRDHCLAHLEEDFVTCVGPTTTSLNGDSLDGIKLSLARWVIGWKLDDPTSYGHTDVRIAAVVAGVPHAAAFDLATLAAPPRAAGPDHRTQRCLAGASLSRAGCDRGVRRL
jgi:predicted dienelactone hydrolase